MQRKTVVFLFAVVAAFLVLATDVTAQIQRVDGSGFVTTSVKLQPVPAPGGPIGDPLCAAVPILEDGWTLSGLYTPDPQNPLLEPETYFFDYPNPDNEFIVFVNKVKLAINPFEPLPQRFEVIEDIFVIPCNPRTAGNPQGEDFRASSPPPLLFIDDVIFPIVDVDEPEVAVEFLLAVYVPLQVLADFFFPTGEPGIIELDWFACADLDSLGSYYGQPASVDLDGDGFPDACFKGRKLLERWGLDDKGANLTLWWRSRAAGMGDPPAPWIEVFEPVRASYIPPYPPAPYPAPAWGLPLVFPGLPGMLPGENGTTRPWCFTLSNRPPGGDGAR